MASRSARAALAAAMVGMSALAMAPAVHAAPGASTIQSDDFSAASLNTALWAVIDARGGSVVTTTGSQLVISVPGGSDHDAGTPNTATRVMQTAGDTDFQVEAKFDWGVNEAIQDQGLIVEESPGRYLRFDVFSDGSSVRSLAALVDATDGQTFADVPGPEGAPVWLRVTRTGNEWRYATSRNGTVWTTHAQFFQAFAVHSVGVYAGNYGGAGAPAQTAVVDYFFNTASPIVPEDAGKPADTTAPVLSGMTVAPASKSALVTWNTGEYATSFVQYGTAPGFFESTKGSFTLTPNHAVRLTGLRRSTRYYYRVVSDDPALNRATATGTFVTPAEVVAVGLVDPSSGEWHVRKANGSEATFFYGAPGDVPVVGDWDCDGDDTPGAYRTSDGFVYLRNANSTGVADVRFFLGIPGDVPLAGDFDGDGCDTIAVYRPSEGRVFLTNRLGADGGFFAAESSFFFGEPGDKPFAGDFDGDGIDTVGLHRESTGFVYFRQSNTQGVADSQFFFGVPGDRLVAGDWTGDGRDTVAIFRPGDSRFYFRNSNTQGFADAELAFGRPDWLPVRGTFEIG